MYWTVVFQYKGEVSMKKLLILTCLTLSVYSEFASAQIADNEARRAILDLRADIKKNAEENKKLFDKWQSDKNASESNTVKANDAIPKFQQSLRDYQNELSKLQVEFEKNIRIQNQAVLQLKTENELMKQQLAELRGDKEQISREMSLIYRSHKDSNAVIEGQRKDIEELRGEKDLLFKEIDLLRRNQKASAK